jgi:NAD(P)-dependent dehydrogenase (short-subunit alcohol dehydrogenase family)
MVLGDFTSLADVKKMAENIKTRYKSLDVLINNAGGVFMDEKESKDGYDITFQINFLSHFLLTNLLLPLLKKNAPSRVIHVSSEAHRYLDSIDFEKLSKPGGYRGFLAYSAAKISVNLFAFELAERLKSSNITSNALHPGVVRTGFGLNTHNILFKGLMHLFRLFLITPEKGAETTIYLASSPEVEGITGKYFDKCKAVPSAKNSDNKSDQKKLWELGEKLVKK